MIFVEVMAGPALPPDRQERIGARITTAVLRADTTDQSTPEAQRSLRGAQALTTVVFHQPTTWVSDARTVEADDPPRFFVRVWVPQSWHADIADHMIRAISGVLAAEDEVPGRLEHEPHLWVHVLGVPETGCGTLGAPISASGILRLITNHGDPPQHPTTEPPPGTLLDPICGMVVRVGPNALTLDHDGISRAFCARACRQAYAEAHGLDVPAEPEGRT